MNELQYDVVVVGAGNAGLVAALAAREKGSRVLLLEAAPQAERGGNSRFSGGIFRFPHDGLDELQAGLINAPDPDLKVEVGPYAQSDFERDLTSTSAGQADPNLVRTLVSNSNRCVHWMRDQGVEWELTLGKLVDEGKLATDQVYSVPPGGAVRAVDEGIGLVKRLFTAVEESEIEVWYDSPVIGLMMRGSTVEGVRVRHQTQTVDVRGRVVLAAGGFESNPEMRLRYLGTGWDLVKVRGTRFNMGTVLSAAISSGAQPVGHWEGCHASPLDADAPPVGDLALTDKMSRYSYPYGILVNLLGKRFIDEGEDEVWLTYAKTGSAIRRQPQATAVQIFDQKTKHLLEPRYATGIPIIADTVKELAKKAGVEASELERTIREFNESVLPGSFDPFTRDGLKTAADLNPPKSNWAVRLDEPPFVAYRVTCGITFTYGGIKIDERARVVDTEDKPMPGLYATGEVTGGLFYHNYPGGSGLMFGAVFGRIAGIEAAAASEV